MPIKKEKPSNYLVLEPLENPSGNVWEGGVPGGVGSECRIVFVGVGENSLMLDHPGLRIGLLCQSEKLLSRCGVDGIVPLWFLLGDTLDVDSVLSDVIQDFFKSSRFLDIWMRTIKIKASSRRQIQLAVELEPSVKVLTGCVVVGTFGVLFGGDTVVYHIELRLEMSQ